MNFFYRSLAAAAGLAEVTAGQKIKIKISLLLAHDGTAGKLLQAWEKAGREKVYNGRQVMITLDHQFPAPTAAARSLHRQLEEFAARENIRLFRRGEGVLHQVVSEREALRPGLMIAGADGHVATSGAFGAVAFSLKPEEMIPPLTTGTLNVEVPEIIEVEVQNRLSFPASPRDLALTLTGYLGGGLARGKAVILSGSGVWELSSSGKMTVCNMLGETGALTGLILPPEMAGKEEPQKITLDAAKIAPVVACPPEPGNIRPLTEVVGLSVTQVVVGGCSSGRLEDMIALVQALGGRKVHPQTNLVVTPASAEVAEAMERDGITRVLRSAGAMINPPGCGPCPGLHLGVLAPGDRVVATIVRNTPGRMGAPEAEIYLASPRTAGLAAAAGSLVVS
jgi:homoaconitase/3-isopropylmalate dehydratase large subunit